MRQQLEIFIEDLENGAETRAIEFKGPGTKPQLLGAIAKAALGFANHRDGGRILIGVTQLPDGSTRADGLDERELESFRVRDFAAELASYGRPPLRVDCVTVPYEGRMFIGITVLPFSGAITICERSTSTNEPITSRIYVRGDETIESRPGRAEDIAALVEMAVEFRLKAQIERLIRAGVLRFSPDLRTDDEDSDEQYRRERGNF